MLKTIDNNEVTILIYFFITFTAINHRQNTEFGPLNFHPTIIILKKSYLRWVKNCHIVVKFLPQDP